MARKGKSLTFYFIGFLLLAAAAVVGFILLNEYFPGWKKYNPFGNYIGNQTILVNETIQNTTVVYPNVAGFNNFLITLVICLLIGFIIWIIYKITQKNNMLFMYSLKKCQQIMFKHLTDEYPNNNITFEEKFGTWGRPFSFFLKDDLRTKWAGCFFSVNKVAKNSAWNPRSTILCICSMKDPKETIFPFLGWDRKQKPIVEDFIEKFHLIAQQTPWARFDAIKLEANLLFESPEFQSGVQEGVKQLGKEQITGVQ